MQRIRLAFPAWAVLAAGAFLGLTLWPGDATWPVAIWPGAARLLHSLAPGPHPDDLALPGLLPAFLIDAPEETIEIYRWAAAHPGLLRFIPCYCGCATMGHDSNAACYLRGARPGGTIWYERHGARCGGSLAVTRDVMALHGSGTPAAQIRRLIEASHGREGPSTPTLWPPR